MATNERHSAAAGSAYRRLPPIEWTWVEETERADIRERIRKEMGEMEVRSIRVELISKSRARGPRIVYSLSNMPVDVRIDGSHDSVLLAKVVADCGAAIEDWCVRAAGPPCIPMLDAVLALRHDHMARLMGFAGRKPPRLFITHVPDDTTTMAVAGVDTVHIPNGLITRAGNQMAVQLHTPTQSWGNGKLTILRVESALIAMQGRPLDDVVSSSILVGTGAVIEGAFQMDQALTLSFPSAMIPMPNAIERVINLADESV